MPTRASAGKGKQPTAEPASKRQRISQRRSSAKATEPTTIASADETTHDDSPDELSISEPPKSQTTAKNAPKRQTPARRRSEKSAPGEDDLTKKNDAPKRITRAVAVAVPATAPRRGRSSGISPDRPQQDLPMAPNETQSPNNEDDTVSQDAEENPAEPVGEIDPDAMSGVEDVVSQELMQEVPAQNPTLPSPTLSDGKDASSDKDREARGWDGVEQNERFADKVAEAHAQDADVATPIVIENEIVDALTDDLPQEDDVVHEDTTHLTVPQPTHEIAETMPERGDEFSDARTLQPQTQSTRPSTGVSSEADPSSLPASRLSPVPFVQPSLQTDTGVKAPAFAPEEHIKLNYRPTHILRGHGAAVTAVSFSPCGSMIASASADCTARVWHYPTGQHIHIFRGHLAGISALSWSPDSRTIATGSDDKAIRLWSLEKRGAHYRGRPLLGHHNYVTCLAFSPKGNVLVSGGYDEAVCLWDIRTGRLMRTLPAHGDPVQGVDFCHDGTLIASCSSDGLIRIWDTGTGQCLRTFFHENTPPVTGIRFCPNSRFVLAWMLDGCLRLWEYIEGRGRCVKTYEGHVNGKFSITGAFGSYEVPTRQRGRGENRHSISDPDNTRAFIVTGSEDGAIVLWDVVSKQVLQRIPPGREVQKVSEVDEIESPSHVGPVFATQPHPNASEHAIVSCGQDSTIRLWKMEAMTASRSVARSGSRSSSSPRQGSHSPHSRQRLSPSRSRSASRSHTPANRPSTLPTPVVEERRRGSHAIDIVDVVDQQPRSPGDVVMEDG